jgi:hypothetical protein
VRGESEGADREQEFCWRSHLFTMTQGGVERAG